VTPRLIETPYGRKFVDDDADQADKNVSPYQRHRGSEDDTDPKGGWSLSTTGKHAVVPVAVLEALQKAASEPKTGLAVGDWIKLVSVVIGLVGLAASASAVAYYSKSDGATLATIVRMHIEAQDKREARLDTTLDKLSASIVTLDTTIATMNAKDVDPVTPKKGRRP
jgi:hypothetical protein